MTPMARLAVCCRWQPAAHHRCSGGVPPVWMVGDQMLHADAQLTALPTVHQAVATLVCLGQPHVAVWCNGSLFLCDTVAAAGTKPR